MKEVFGWIKTIALQRKTRFRGLERVGWMFTFAAAAYNSCGCARFSSQSLRKKCVRRRNQAARAPLPIGFFRSHYPLKASNLLQKPNPFWLYTAFQQTASAGYLPRVVKQQRISRPGQTRELTASLTFNAFLGRPVRIPEYAVRIRANLWNED